MNISGLDSVYGAGTFESMAKNPDGTLNSIDSTPLHPPVTQAVTHPATQTAAQAAAQAAAQHNLQQAAHDGMYGAPQNPHYSTSLPQPPQQHYPRTSPHYYDTPHHQQHYQQHYQQPPEEYYHSKMASGARPRQRTMRADIQSKFAKTSDVKKKELKVATQAKNTRVGWVVMIIGVVVIACIVIAVFMSARRRPARTPIVQYSPAPYRQAPVEYMDHTNVPRYIGPVPQTHAFSHVGAGSQPHMAHPAALWNQGASAVQNNIHT